MSPLLGDGRNLAAELQRHHNASEIRDQAMESVGVVESASYLSRLRAGRPRVVDGTRHGVAIGEAATKDAGLRQLLHMGLCVHGGICCGNVEEK